MNPKVVLVVRILLGVMMVFFGLNKFGNWMQFPEMPAPAGAFMGALMATGYIMPIVAVVEIVTGLSFLSGKFVPLAAVILFPVMLNAFLFHAVLDPANIAGAALALAMNIFLFFAYKSRYDSILQA